MARANGDTYPQAIPASKPRLYRWFGEWVCKSGRHGFSSFMRANGSTPHAAYAAWKEKAEQ